MKTILSVVFSVIVSVSFSQKATLRGVVTDGTTGEAIPFAGVYLENNTSVGSTTDFDGMFTLKLDPGTYKVVFAATTYTSKVIEITLKAGESKEQNMVLNSSDSVLDAVEIVAEKKAANTMAAYDREKMNSANMIDGTSSEQMKKTGDADAGEVMKRVTGVSVIGGRQVYVRGLGDRYTKTMLNGMEIPGLDPDRNSIQMDVFPTSLIDNLTVYKTFTPNLPGDFTGGLVNVITKDFPSKKTITFSTNWGYNTTASFNPNFLKYKGGKLDALGFDDGTRANPVGIHEDIPDPLAKDQKTGDIARRFSKTMAPYTSPAFLNQRHSFSIGNQVNLKNGMDYGYNFVVNYQNRYSQNENTQYNTYTKDPEKVNYEFVNDISQKGTLSTHDVMWSVLLGQAIKYNKRNKIALNLFHTQNGISTAAKFIQEDFENNPATLDKTSLQYTQRSVSNINLSGKHTVEKWDIDWGISPSYSILNDPDIRSTILERTGNGVEVPFAYQFQPSVGSQIRRIFRNLNEFSVNSKVDFTRTFEGIKSLESKLKFGVFETSKFRSFKIYDYNFLLRNYGPITNDPNDFFKDENVWSLDTDRGIYAKDGRQLANSYDAKQHVLAGYAMTEMPITEKLKTVYGVRAEKAQIFYTGQNNSGTEVYFNEKVLDNLSILPSFNFVYAIRDSIAKTMNLRGSYAKTLARPSFREKSISQIYDPIQGRRYNGNLDLVQTDIHNFDLRWEYFYGRTELLTASVFYKKFINPIEIVSFDLAPTEVKPNNAGTADVYGAEVEFRKRLGFINDDAKRVYVGANYTYVVSKINMNLVMIDKGTNKVSEKDIRQNNAREGEVIGDFRPMYGQSPYIINAFANFTNDSIGLDINLSYNVQGKRLVVVGIGSLPDVYEQPFHSLNLRVTKTIGKDKKWNAGLTVQNILNNVQRSFYEAYGAQSQIYNWIYDGRMISLSLNYKF